MVSRMRAGPCDAGACAAEHAAAESGARDRIERGGRSARRRAW